MFEINNKDCIIKASSVKEVIKGLEQLLSNKEYFTKIFPNKCEISIHNNYNPFFEIRCSCGIKNVWRSKKITSYICKCGRKLIKLMDKNKFDFIANRSEQ